MRVFSSLLVILMLFTFSCVNEDTGKRKVLNKMNESFKVYIRDNDLRKDLVTKLKKVEAISYKELEESEREHKDEFYEAKVHMQGTTSYMRSVKIYNMDDTVTCYFDENLKMLRLVNPNNEE